MDIFELHHDLAEIIGERCDGNEDIIDAVYHCISTIAKYEKSALDISDYLLAAAFTVAFSSNPDEAFTTYRNKVYDQYTALGQLHINYMNVPEDKASAPS